jgi:hypothetical protein
MRAKYLLPFLLITSFSISCNDQPTCIPEHTDLLKIIFTDVSGKAKKITFVSLTVDGSNENFPVFEDTTASSFSIPLNALDSAVIIRFEQVDKSNFLALSYQVLPIVLNPVCALESKFDFLKIDSTDMANTVVVDPLLSLETNKNVRITY